VEEVKGSETDPKLPASGVDVVLMVDVYHELAYPFEVMTKVREALKPGGRVVFVEYRKEDPRVPIKEVHKMSVEQLCEGNESGGACARPDRGIATLATHRDFREARIRPARPEGADRVVMGAEQGRVEEEERRRITVLRYDVRPSGRGRCAPPRSEPSGEHPWKKSHHTVS
jgi:SAM-dependent methyltransferase